MQVRERVKQPEGEIANHGVTWFTQLNFAIFDSQEHIINMYIFSIVFTNKHMNSFLVCGKQL